MRSGSREYYIAEFRRRWRDTGGLRRRFMSAPLSDTMAVISTSGVCVGRHHAGQGGLGNTFDADGITFQQGN